MTNYAVIGLGHGDEGKGATTDWLCRNRDVGLVVRHNGGGQAGHNVVAEDGRHHTFSQWGSGTLAGVPTFLSRFMVVDPLALVPEAEHLQSIGVVDPWSLLTIDPQAIVVTPWHRAAQRFEEKLRGDRRHGTCGMGIGKAVDQAIHHPDRTLRWGDLVNSTLVGTETERVMDSIRGGVEYVSPLTRFMRLRFEGNSLASMEHSDGEHPWARQPDEVAQEFIRIATMPRTEAWGTGWVGARAHRPGVVFEGAQGVLLDENYGFHPHTTWSTTTPTNADVLASEAGLEKPYRLGVTRAYSHRHGPGPFPTEDGWKPEEEPHNVHDDWRGGVRYGPLDLVLLRYAVDACGGVDGIAVTHLDAPHPSVVDCWSTPFGAVDYLIAPKKPDLARQEAIGGILRHSRPASRLPTAVPTAVAFATRTDVVLESYGPTAADRKDVGVPR